MGVRVGKKTGKGWLVGFWDFFFQFNHTKSASTLNRAEGINPLKGQHKKILLRCTYNGGMVSIGVLLCSYSGGKQRCLKKTVYNIKGT